MAERTPWVEAIVISDSFQGALTALVTEVGGRFYQRPPGGGAAPEPPAAVMVLAGGREGEALAQLPSLDGTPWYFIGAAADHRLAAAAVRAGARDYLVLPEDLDVLRRSLDRDIRTALGRVDAAHFAAEEADAGFAAIVGRSPGLTQVLNQARKVAGHRDVTVLLGGETGTGKELLARADALREPARRGPVRRGELRGDPREPPGERALRARARGVHGSGGGQARDSSSRRTAARSFSTRSATCRSSCRPSCSGRWRTARSGGWAAPRRKTVDIRLLAATHIDLARAVVDRTFARTCTTG